LRDYLGVVESIYAPDRYFDRVRRVCRRLGSSQRRYKPSLGRWARELRGFFRMARRLGMAPATRREFWHTFLDTLSRNPRAIRYTGALVGLYLHMGPFARYVAERLRAAIADEERAPSRVALPPSRKVKPTAAVHDTVGRLALRRQTS
jgi:hypothetical protein